MNKPTAFPNFAGLLVQRPQAIAGMQGSKAYPTIHGSVRFYQTKFGVLVAAEIAGLPSPSGPCESPIFGFHLHEGESCTGNDTDPFAVAMTHYNPQYCPHPYHAGDFPPLFSNHGIVFTAFLTDRFMLKDIIGKTLIIHAAPDDFTTQPSGNSGAKIACGVVSTVR